MKTCSQCGVEKPLTAFSVKRAQRSRDGALTHREIPSARCKRCVAANARRSFPERREAQAKIIREAKDVPCADCGVRYPYYVMDFDHVRGEKSFGIGGGTGRHLNKLIEEIAKCDVVCANCHRERTFREYEWRGVRGERPGVTYGESED